MSTAIKMRSPVVVAGERERQILLRIDRAVRITEDELRYQLRRKDDHPLAGSAQLLDALGDLERRGLVEHELCLRLTAAGREQLAGPPRTERRDAS